ncbi:MAG: hypothetical protein ACQEXJ_24060 [Myxococcota bacterium]
MTTRLPRRHTAATVLIPALLLVAATSGPARAQDDDWGLEEATKPLDPAEARARLDELVGALDDLDDATVSTAQATARLADAPQAVLETLHDKISHRRIVNASQLATLLSVDLESGRMDLLLTDNCVLCHVDPETQSDGTLFLTERTAGTEHAHLALSSFVGDVHFRKGLSCSGCHGGSPDVEDHVPEMADTWPSDREEDRTWIPEFCGRCHSDPDFMRTYAPDMPTDQVAKYRKSRHGQRLLRHDDSKVAQCVSCHGVHGILGPDSPRSTVHPQSLPETCGTCHSDAEYMAGYETLEGDPLPTDQVAKLRDSIHGRALLEEGELGAPACNDCHGKHAARPPEVSSVSQVCRTCHLAQGRLFDGSAHKEAFEAHGWAECGVCHGNHDIDRATDAMLGPGDEGVCQDCHAEYAGGREECAEAAAHFRATIHRLSSEHDDFRESIEDVARRGLDPEPLEVAVSDLEQALVETRNDVHAFDRNTFDKAADEGREAADRAHEILGDVREEFRFRRNGVLVSVAIMVLLALGIHLKLRDVERRQSRDSGDS